MILSAGQDLLQQVRRLPDRYSAVCVVRTDPARARGVAEASYEDALRPVLTEQDAEATALCAAVLRHLRRVGRQPTDSRVLVADSARNPSVASLLMVCGVFDLAVWSQADAARFPLRSVLSEMDAVADLRPPGNGQDDLSLDRPEGSMVRTTGLDARMLVAPGVLRTASAFGPGEAPVSLDMLRLCAQAISEAPPVHSAMAALPADDIADRVAYATKRMIDPRFLRS
ncbi:MAG: hypothetical protein ABS81_04750 [Pseudonocardia sp. SCN 72-86]|nr:MAG: hypothetical protein ABS81_04750 [Pseudonocardia sp. SCN 72-86]